MTSAYPIEVDALVKRVRAHAEKHGAVPTQNEVMNLFKVGRPKAKAALAAMRSAGSDTDPGHERDTAAAGAPRRLHSVPDDSSSSEPVSTVVDAPGPRNEQPSGNPAPASAGVDVADATSAPAEKPDTTPSTQPAAPASVTSAPAHAGFQTARAGFAAVAGWLRGWWARLPLLLIAGAAFVSIWSGWVGIGELTGFGPIRLLPGIRDDWVINSAITLPLGVEAYAAYALRVWLAPDPHGVRTRLARRFAAGSAIGALVLGAAGQIAYHLMVADGVTKAPWQITAFVSCLPVIVLGCGAALTHLTRNGSEVR